jgi:hypothetical protein
MPGRGDNNKHGSAGRGSSNQSNQPFVSSNHNEPASDHARNRTGGTQETSFNILLDNVPYMVTASPFDFNGETRFYVSVNGGEPHVFTWDSELREVRAIDDAASVLPNGLEEEISQKLQRL